MNEELITSVSELLSEWNPLGEGAESVPDLEGYKYEAIDIISDIQIMKASVEKAVSDVLTQAFGITLSKPQLKHYSSKIEQVINLQ